MCVCVHVCVCACVCVWEGGKNHVHVCLSCESLMLQSDKQCSPTNSRFIRDRDRQSYGNTERCFLFGMSWGGNPKTKTGSVLQGQSARRRRRGPSRWVGVQAQRRARCATEWWVKPSQTGWQDCRTWPTLDVRAHTCSCNVTCFIIMIMIKSISLTMRREGEEGSRGLLSPLIAAVGREWEKWAEVRMKVEHGGKEDLAL